MALSGPKHGLRLMLCQLRFRDTQRLGSCCNQYKSVWAASFHRIAQMVEQFLSRYRGGFLLLLVNAAIGGRLIASALGAQE